MRAPPPRAGPVSPSPSPSLRAWESFPSSRTRHGLTPWSSATTCRCRSGTISRGRASWSHGVGPWLKCGETFSVVFGLFGRFAPLARAAGQARRTAGHGGGAMVAAQLPMLFLMVGYTVFSLWIIGQPIVEV